MYGDGSAIPLLLLYALFNWKYALSAILVVVFLIIVPACLIFQKTGRAWWEGLIPFYNLYIFTKIIGVRWWYLFAIFIPYLGIFVVYLYFSYLLGKRFGLGTLTTLILIVFPFALYPILGYGDFKYSAPGVKAN